MKTSKQKKPTGKTLIRAIRKNDSLGVYYALKNGAPANYVNEHGESAINIACNTFDVKARIIELLIEKGAIDGCGYGDIQQSFEIAVRCDNAAAYEPLIKAGARVNRHVLSHAPVFRDWRREKILLDLGEKYSRFEELSFDSSIPAQPRFIPFDKKEAVSVMLSGACEKGDITLAKKLIEAGADVNGTGEHSYSPIFCCFRDVINSKLIRLLIKNGANVNCFDDYEMTPLDYAVRRRSIAAISALFEANALTSSELKHRIRREGIKAAKEEQENNKKKGKPKWREGNFYTMEEICELYNVSREEAGERLGHVWITYVDGKRMIQGDDVYRAFEMNKGNNLNDED